MEPKFKTLQEIADSNFIFNGRDIVSIGDFNRAELDFVLDVADWFKRAHKEKRRDELEETLRRAAVALVFAEPSTRTRFSFETAAKSLGAKLLPLADPETSSFKKGEPLRDALRMFEQYANVLGDDAVLVMRHKRDGAARHAADVLNIPFINAGDGKNQHPTQTFLDLYTIRETQEIIDGLKVAICGDLKYGRTVHSLATALSQYDGVKMYFVSPSDSLQMPDYILDVLKEKGIEFEQLDQIEGAVKADVDILYMTRIQRERFDDAAEYEKVKDVFKLTADMLKDARPAMKVLHPLPRCKEALEMLFDVDKTPQASYCLQALNGIFVREALLALVTGRAGNPAFTPQPLGYAHLPNTACPNEKCITDPQWNEGVEPRFLVDDRAQAKCYYCGTRVERGNIK